MTPNELRNLLLYGPRTDETQKKLPDSAGELWLNYPERENVERAKLGSYVRWVLIVLGIGYYAAFDRYNDLAGPLLFVVACYEFAYSNLRKEKNQIDYLLAIDRYEIRVDEYLGEKFKGYKPPVD